MCQRSRLYPSSPSQEGCYWQQWCWKLSLWSEIHLYILPGNLRWNGKGWGDENWKNLFVLFGNRIYFLRNKEKKNRREISNISCCCNFTNLWQALKCQKFTPRGFICHITTIDVAYSAVCCSCTTKTSCLEKQCFAKNSLSIWLNNILFTTSLFQL